MTDVPDDLSSVGKHRGNQPPTETGQEVRSPEGPDPQSTSATRTAALFQLLRHDTEGWLRLRVHSARADVSEETGDVKEVGQYRTVHTLRTALREESIAGTAGVFEDADSGEVLTDEHVTTDHAWIGQPRFQTITFFPSAEAASEYVDSLTDTSARTD